MFEIQSSNFGTLANQPTHVLPRTLLSLNLVNNVFCWTMFLSPKKKSTYLSKNLYHKVNLSLFKLRNIITHKGLYILETSTHTYVLSVITALFRYAGNIFFVLLLWRKSLKIISNLKLSLPTWKKYQYISTQIVKYIECMSNHVVGIYCVYLYCFLRSYVLIQVALTCTLDNITVQVQVLQ